MTGSFDYTPNDLINPIGANDLAALAMYYQRSLYEEKIYPAGAAVPLDLYYNKQLYGKVDPKQHTIVTSAPSLVPIESSNAPNLYAVAPVVLAFEKFVAHMRQANIMGVAVNRGNPRLYDIKAEHAFESPVRQYKAFLEGIWKVYYDNFTPEQNEKIIDFASFAEDYRRYLLQVVTTYPVSQTNFLLTPSVSPFASGLAIGIDDGDCGDDNYKYVNYLSDPNYDFYTKVAKKFGFMVNRNAPWILWADIYSPAFYTNLEFYYEEGSPMPVTRETFFRAFYTPTWKTDLQLLQGAFEEAYRTLVYHKPFAEVFPPRKIGVGVTTYVEACTHKPLLRTRPPASAAQRAAVLNDKFLLDFYIDLRHTEAVTEDVHKEEVRHRAYEYYRAHLDSSLTPLENGVKYVDEVYARYVYTRQNIVTAFPNLARAAANNRYKKQGYI